MKDKYMSHARLGVAVLLVGAGRWRSGLGSTWRGNGEHSPGLMAHALWRVSASVAGFPMPWRVW